jgi:hypothetical protein
LAGVNSALGALVGRGGVHPHLGAQMAVTQNGSPNMTVNVGTGVVTVPGTEGATQSGYVCVATSTTNLAITAAHASLPRIDLVVAQVLDSQYSGGSDLWQLAVVAGTPAGSPTAPSAPNNSVILAQVAVAASATQILTANITDRRPYSSYGVITCRTSADYPSPAIEGMVVYDQQYNNISVYDGATWTSPRGTTFLQRVIVPTTAAFLKANFPGLKKVRAQVQGGGGAGGGAGATAASQTAAAGGGQAGAYAESWLDASSLAASVTCTVGTGGVGVSGGTGGNGNQSSFGAHVVAPGGNGAVSGGGGGTTFGQAGGQGTQVMTGEIQIQGGPGNHGARLGTIAGQRIGGVGGGSPLGTGGFGGSATAGGVGTGYGSGGGGATNDPSLGAKAGGNGAAGVVILDLYV